MTGALGKAERGWEGLKGAMFSSSLDLGVEVDGFVSLEPPRFILLAARCEEPTRMEDLNRGAVFFFGWGVSVIWFVFVFDRESTAVCLAGKLVLGQLADTGRELSSLILARDSTLAWGAVDQGNAS